MYLELTEYREEDKDNRKLIYSLYFWILNDLIINLEQEDTGQGTKASF